MRVNYYEILGIQEDASLKEIKKAYKELAKKYHPDVNAGDPSANERFKEIVLAYETLCDTITRTECDSTPAEPRMPDEEWEREYLLRMMAMSSRRNPRGCR